jgi:hypothetical protein
MTERPDETRSETRRLTRPKFGPPGSDPVGASCPCEASDVAAEQRDRAAETRDEIAAQRDESSEHDDVATIDRHVALFDRLRRREAEIDGVLEFARSDDVDQARFTIEILAGVLERVMGDIGAVRDLLAANDDDRLRSRTDRVLAARDRVSAEDDRTKGAGDRIGARDDRDSRVGEQQQRELEDATRQPPDSGTSPSI